MGTLTNTLTMTLMGILTIMDAMRDELMAVEWSAPQF